MDSDTQELQIDTTEGLQTFWGYVNDVYAELQTLHLSDEISDRAEELYDALKTHIEICLEAKERGGHVSDQDAVYIQTGYDELFTILEHPQTLPRTTAHSMLSGDISSSQNTSHDITPPPTHTSPYETVANSSGTNRDISTTYVPVTSEHPNNALLYEASAVAKKASDLRDLYNHMPLDSFSPEVRSVAEHYRFQLDISVRRARTTEQQLSEKLSGGTPHLSDLVREHFEDIIEEISENVDQLTIGLTALLPATEKGDLPNQKKSPATPPPALKSQNTKSQRLLIESNTNKKQLPAAKDASQKIIHNQSSVLPQSKTELLFESQLSKHIERVLSIPRYGTFVSERIGSPVQAEAMIRREILQVEALSKFETIFNFSYASAFYSLLLTMTAQEISEFDSQPRNTIRAILNEKNIKYENYLEWIDLLLPALELTRAHANVPFAELFIRAHLEVLIRESSETEK